MNSKRIKRGYIYMADLELVKGSEQGGKRPVVIIQNDIGNKSSPTTIVAPVSSQLKNKHIIPTHVFIDKTGRLDKASMIMLEQVRTLDKTRLTTYMGRIKNDDMEKVDRALAISIGLCM